LSYALTLSEPVVDLPPRRPTASLLGPATVASVLGMQIIDLAFLVGALFLMQGQVRYTTPRRTVHTHARARA
jgi:hypothetical protein